MVLWEETHFDLFQNSVKDIADQFHLGFISRTFFTVLFHGGFGKVCEYSEYKVDLKKKNPQEC